MKIALDSSGSYLSLDEGPRDTRHHKRIMMIRNIPNTRTGHHLRLECVHGEVQTRSGNLHGAR